MKKLLVIVIILLVAVLMTQTVPTKEEHKEAMMKAVNEYLDEEAANHGLGDNLLTDFAKGIASKAVETALNSKLKVDNYYVLNTTHVRLNGENQILSVGVFGHVFTFDKEMLREKLEEALNANEEAENEKEAAKRSKKEMKQLQKEQAKREKELAKEKKRREKEAAKEQKRREKELAKEQKQREKEARKAEKQREKEARKLAKEA